MLGASSSWGAPSLQATLEVAGYKAKQYYDFTTNTPEVLPTVAADNNLTYRSGWGLHNYGSGARSATATIPVAAGDLVVFETYTSNNNASGSVTINTGTLNSSLSTTTGYVCYDIAAAADNITFTTPRYWGVRACLVMEKDANAATADYTINYLLNGQGEPVKTTTGNAAVGSQVATETSFFENDVKYFRADGAPTSCTITANDNTFNVSVRLAATYNYSLLDNFDKVVTTGSGYEGETATAPYPRYQLQESTLYEAGVTNKEYRKTIALTQDNATASITYAAKENVNVVFFTEAENINGMSISTTGNIPVRASNAKGATAAEDVAITTLPAGKYKLHVGIFTSKSSYGENTVNFGVGNETFSAGFTSVNLSEVASEEYVLTGETAITYLGTTTWADAQFDYIWIEKTGDYVDPLATEKEALSQAITTAENTSTDGKTAESVQALTQAINAANDALNDANATAESLTQAKNDLETAIQGLEDEPVDIAQALVNPSFEYAEKDVVSTAGALTNGGSYYGWTLPNLGTSFVNISIGDANACNGNAFGIPTAKDGSFYYYARRGWNSSTSADATLSTTLASLPEGQYIITMNYKGLDSWDNDHNSKGSYLKLTATQGDNELGASQTETFEAVNGNNAGSGKFTGDANWKEASLEFIVTTPGDVDFNIVHHLVGGVRTDVAIDNIVIKSAAEIAAANLKTEIDKAEALLGNTYNTEGRDAMQQAIATAQALLSASDASAINNGIETLQAAETTFAQANLPVKEEGVYYVYNPLTKKFLSRGNAYGTAAVVDDYGTAVTVTPTDGTYTLSATDIKNNYGFDAWMYADANGNNVRSYTTTNVENGFTLTNTTNHMMVYVYMKDDADKYRVAGNAIKGDNYSDDAQTVWQFLTKAERDQIVADRETAEKTAAFTAAELALDAEITADGDAVEVSVKNGNAWTTTIVRAQDNQPGVNENGTEMWQATGKMTQTIANLTSGLYKISAHAFYRNGNADEDQTRVATGYNTVLTYIEANGNKKQVQTWTSGKGEGNDPNGMSAAAAKFAAGNYLTEFFTFVGEDGNLNLTINNPGHIGNGWFIIGDVSYQRMFVDPLAEAKADLQNDIDAAKALITEDTKRGLDAFNKAIKDAEDAISNEATAETLAQAKNDLATAKELFVKMNNADLVAALALLQQDIDAAKVLYNDESNTEGREQMQQAIADAEVAMETISTATEWSAARKALADAVTAFTEANAEPVEQPTATWTAPEVAAAQTITAIEQAIDEKTKFVADIDPEDASATAPTLNKNNSGDFFLRINAHNSLTFIGRGITKVEMNSVSAYNGSLECDEAIGTIEKEGTTTTTWTAPEGKKLNYIELRNWGGNTTTRLYAKSINVYYDTELDADYVTAVDNLEAEIATAQALKTENKTNGLDEFNAAITAAKASMNEQDKNAVNTAIETLQAAEAAFENANKAETEEVTATSTFTTKEWTVTEGEPEWTADANGTAFDNQNGRGVQWGKNKGTVTLTSNDSFTDMTKVVVVASANGTDGKLSVKVGETTIGEELTIESGTANKNMEYTFTATAAVTGNVIVTATEGDHSIWVKSISVTYQQEKEVLPEGVAEARESLQLEIDAATALLADESKTEGRDELLTAINDAKQLLNSTVLDDINTGIQTLQTAEAAFEEANKPVLKNEYEEDVAEGETKSVVFTPTSETNFSMPIELEGGISLIFDKGEGDNTPAFSNNTGRLYQHNTLAVEGKQITKVVVNISGTWFSSLVTNEDGQEWTEVTKNDADWTWTAAEGKAATKVYLKNNTGRQIRYTSIEVFYTEAAVPAGPVTFDFANTTHEASTSSSNAGNIADEEIVEEGVVMTATDGSTATRFWESNGSKDLRIYKNGGSLKFTAPEGKAIVKVSFTGTAVLLEAEANNGTWETPEWTGNAIEITFNATGTNKLTKAEVTLADKDENTYTPEEVHIENTEETAYTVTEAVELIDAGKALSETVYVKGIVSKVDKFNDDNTITYWISADGTTEGQQFECYHGKGIAGADFASIDDVKVGAEIIAKGVMKKYNDTYEFDKNNELVKYEWTDPNAIDLTTIIQNPGFEESEAATANIVTTDKAENSVDYANTGWKLTATSVWSASAVVAYGSEVTLNSANAPAADNAGNTGKALGVTVGWGGKVTYESAEAITLPAGTYTLKANAYNAGTATDFASKLAFITTDGTTYISTKNSFTLNTWETDEVTFTLTEETEGKFQIGGETTKNAGSGSHGKVFFDNLTIEENLDAAKTVYENALADAKSAKENVDFADVTGEELTALSQAIEENETLTEETMATLTNATIALTEATKAFVDAKGAYADLAAAKAIEVPELTYAAEEKRTAVENAKDADPATSAADAETKATAITTALRQYYESHALAENLGAAAIDMTNLIADPNFEGLTATNKTVGEHWTYTQTGGTVGVLNSEPLTDGDGNSNYSYFDYWNGSDNNQHVKQTVAIEATGTYMLTAAMRGQDVLADKLFLKAGDVTEKAQAIGNQGGVFGRGWNDVSVIFGVEEAGDVTIEAYSQLSNKGSWWGATRFRLVKLSDNPDPTGINELKANRFAGTAVYNLRGQKVEHLTKGGLYIVNGKKMVVK